MVEQIAGVDEIEGTVYFTGTRDGPLETHLPSQALSRSEPASGRSRESDAGQGQARNCDRSPDEELHRRPRFAGLSAEGLALLFARRERRDASLRQAFHDPEAEESSARGPGDRESPGWRRVDSVRGFVQARWEQVRAAALSDHDQRLRWTVGTARPRFVDKHGRHESAVSAEQRRFGLQG